MQRERTLIYKHQYPMDTCSAYGCVYKAQHKATEQIIAIKTVLFGSENEGAAEIKKEIEILRHCRHPNIVCLYGCTEKARELWVCMIFQAATNNNQQPTTGGGGGGAICY